MSYSMLFNPGLYAQELNFLCTFPLSLGIPVFCQLPSMHVHSITVGWILMFQLDRQKMEASRPLKLKVSAIIFPEMTETEMKKLT